MATAAEFDACRSNPVVPGGARTLEALSAFLEQLAARPTPPPRELAPGSRGGRGGRGRGRGGGDPGGGRGGRRIHSAPLLPAPALAPAPRAPREPSCRRRVLSVLNRVSGVTFERMRAELIDALGGGAPAEAGEAASMIAAKACLEPRSNAEIYVRLLLEAAAGVWCPEASAALLGRAREEARGALEGLARDVADVSAASPDPSRDYDGFCESVLAKTRLIGRCRVSCMLARRAGEAWPAELRARAVAEAGLAALDAEGQTEAALELAVDCLRAVHEECGTPEERDLVRRGAAARLADRLPALGSRARHKALVLLGRR